MWRTPRGVRRPGGTAHHVSPSPSRRDDRNKEKLTAFFIPPVMYSVDKILVRAPLPSPGAKRGGLKFELRINQTTDVDALIRTLCTRICPSCQRSKLNETIAKLKHFVVMGCMQALYQVNQDSYRCVGTCAQRKHNAGIEVFVLCIHQSIGVAPVKAVTCDGSQVYMQQYCVVED